VRVPTIVLSAVFHVGLAAGLVAVAQQRELKKHRAISVAVAEEKKKAAKPAPPPPPRPIARPAPAHVVQALAKTDPAPVAHVAAAPVTTNLTMNNGDSDVGPGIGLHGPAPKTTSAAPVKVASAISERRVHRAEEEATGEAPCAEEPTKPEPVVKTEINYALYPQAQADGVEGKIKIRFTVGVDGQVEKVDVVSGIEPGLDAAVVAAAQRWRFKPALACGKPVAGGTYVFQARFELGN
jgi:TonB family protein